MKYPRLPVWILAAALITAAAVLFVTRWNGGAEANTAAAAPAQFLLIDSGGRVAVCSASQQEERALTSINVALLPTADKEALKSGIPARDSTALAMLLEDLGC